jgi:hypothetical protein
MERSADEWQRAGFLASAESQPLEKGTAMRIRIVTFGLNILAEAYTAHAEHIASGFTAWPGLLGKWWLADTASGTFGGVYLFASQHDADRSRGTDLFRAMFDNPALKDVTVAEYDVLDAPTAITAPALLTASALQSALQVRW